MVGRRAAGYWHRLRDEFRKAFAEHHTPHEVAGSYALGIFVTVLPSLGIGILFFLLLIRLTDRVSKIAIFAAAITINPVVKAPMYVAAFWIGNRLLGGGAIGPQGGVAGSAPGVAVRMILGFVVLGFALGAVSYAVVYVLVTQYRRRELEVVEEVVDDESEGEESGEEE